MKIFHNFRKKGWEWKSLPILVASTAHPNLADLSAYTFEVVGINGMYFTDLWFYKL